MTLYIILGPDISGNWKDYQGPNNDVYVCSNEAELKKALAEIKSNCNPEDELLIYAHGSMIDGEYQGLHFGDASLHPADIIEKSGIKRAHIIACHAGYGLKKVENLGSKENNQEEEEEKKEELKRIGNGN